MDQRVEDSWNGISIMQDCRNTVKGSLHHTDDRWWMYISGEAARESPVPIIRDGDRDGVLDRTLSEPSWIVEVTPVGGFPDDSGGVKGIISADGGYSGI